MNAQAFVNVRVRVRCRTKKMNRNKHNSYTPNTRCQRKPGDVTSPVLDLPLPCRGVRRNKQQCNPHTCACWLRLAHLRQGVV
jgi:hypothetical protein